MFVNMKIRTPMLAIAILALVGFLGLARSSVG